MTIVPTLDRSARIRRALHSFILRIMRGPACEFPSRSLFAHLGFLAVGYEAALRYDQRRMLRAARRLPAPVISVGNLTVGGTGKTPLVLLLARYLLERGFTPAILSRGFRRTGKGIGCVPPDGDPFPLVPLFGDEPVLIARAARPTSVWVGKDRFRSGIKAIETSGADVLLLDDGFQRLSLCRDLDLVLLDSENPFGNGRLLPLGPLREPIEAIERADAFVLTRADDPAKTSNLKNELLRRFPGRPVFACRHEQAGFVSSLFERYPATGLAIDRPSIAFAGIAGPESFFESLRDSGVRLSRTLSYPDHHIYSPADLSFILETVRRAGAGFLITTEKDAVRLPLWMRDAVLTVGLKLSFGSDEPAFFQFLDEIVGRFRNSSSR